MTLLSFNSKYVVTSAVAVTTSSTTLVDDTEASQFFNLAAQKTVLVIYQHNSNYDATNPHDGIQAAISVDTVDKANSWDSPNGTNYCMRNCTFWIGTLAAGDHTIKGRWCAKSTASTHTINNRILLIYIFDGDEFQYTDDATTRYRTATTLGDDANATFTFTPSASCVLLALYNASHGGGNYEDSRGKRIVINIAGTAYGQAEKCPATTNYPDSVFTAHALAQTAEEVTVKGQFSSHYTGAYATIQRRQFGVLLLPTTCLLDIVTSTTLVSSETSALADDAQATINRTPAAAGDLLVIAVGTKRYLVSSSNEGECYGIMVDTVDKTLSRASPQLQTGPTSAATVWAQTFTAAAHTIKGRYSNNNGVSLAKISARQLIALWFQSTPPPTVTTQAATLLGLD
jgi:hypothetical protein